MSRNGSGVYSLPAGNPVVTGTTISSSWANTTLSDIATALTGSVASDGQTAMTGNLQMGNNKVTGLAVATTSGDALSYAQAATVSDLAVTGNATVGGTLTLTGGLTLNGNVTVGDSSSDTLTVNATSTFAAGATFSSTFAANGGVTLGDASGDALTINSSAVSIPNGLTFSGGTTTFSNNQVISVTDNTNAALRITQLGTGNALLVEDSSNPDSTPFVIDSVGQVISGYTSAISTDNYAGAIATPAIQQHGTSINTSTIASTVWSSGAGSTASGLILSRSKSSTIGTNAIVASGDTLGTVSFNGDDGTAFVSAASIIAAVDGTPGTNDMPGRLVFSTTADGASSPTERMRIRSDGNIGIGGSGGVSAIIYNQKAITGATIAYGYRIDSTVQSDVTSTARANFTNLATAAAAFTLTNLNHYEASQSTFGAGSAVTNQFGFIANSNLIGATNNYGFYSNIASGTGRWNFYAAGTADNYFAGNLGLGVTPFAYSSETKAIDIGAYGVGIANTAGYQATYANNAYYNAGWKYKATGYQSAMYEQNSGAHKWYSAPSGTAGNAISFTQAMTLDASGNLGIGTTSPSYKLDVAGATQVNSNAFGAQGGYYLNSGGNANARRWLISNDTNAFGDFVISTSTTQTGSPTTQRLIIDSSGNLLVGTTSQITNEKLGVLQTANASGISINTNNTSFTGVSFAIFANRNTTNNTFYAMQYYNSAAGVSRFLVADSGNVTNTNGSYGAISDIKLKENIVDATPKLEKLNQVRVVNYNIKGETQKQIGVIAQELEQIFPSMIDESPDRDADGNDLGTTTKSVKYSVFVPMLIKAVQELKAELDTVKAELNTLKGN